MALSFLTPNPITCYMKFAKPKLIPTLICLAIVGLFAAIVPYPGFVSRVTVVSTTAAE